ncbi:unnamed protein product [Kuraishia capsulata CBS 1993]|uniref:Zn(2)-C6 fungal-type domain-containing protein n=1 Tax=Kuraishia capsulata CBS 1993 TaxID=1382522 RepID=W6MP97_9ASCO|nr:uncharacterized protein KUCA_T00004449001 [Kuraishia capsulata CBS 1993]CDK28466.1 unnamed protein product [Kuraishia capsulata CBS 1993]
MQDLRLLKLSDTSCASCRARKVKCDRTLPACKTCLKNNHACLYVGKRKPGPRPFLERQKKNDNMRMLKFVDKESKVLQTNSVTSADSPKDIRMQIDQLVMPKLNNSPMPTQTLTEEDILFDPHENVIIISRKLRIAVSDLHDRFFKYLLRSMPIILRERYLKKFDADRTSHMYLRYAVWAISAFVFPEISFAAPMLYRKSMRALTDFENRDTDRFGGIGGTRFRYSVEYLQALVICSSLEFLQGLARKSVVTLSKAVRVSQLMKLHLLDVSSDAKIVTNGGDSDPWEVVEEKRRIFWKIFCMDRYIYISTWLPTAVSDGSIYTKLPAYDLFFQSRIMEESYFLQDAFKVLESEDLSAMPDINSYALHILALAATEKIFRYMDDARLSGKMTPEHSHEHIERFKDFEAQLFKIQAQGKLSVESGRLSAALIVNSTCLIAFYETVCEYFSFLETSEPEFYEKFRIGSLQTTLAFFDNLKYFANDKFKDKDCKAIIQHLLDAGALTDPSLFASLHAFSKSVAFHVIRSKPTDDREQVENLKSKLDALTLVLDKLSSISGMEWQPRKEENWAWMHKGLETNDISLFRNHICDVLYLKMER